MASPPESSPRSSSSLPFPLSWSLWSRLLRRPLGWGGASIVLGVGLIIVSYGRFRSEHYQYDQYSPYGPYRQYGLERDRPSSFSDHELTPSTLDGIPLPEDPELREWALQEASHLRSDSEETNRRQAIQSLASERLPHSAPMRSPDDRRHSSESFFDEYAARTDELMERLGVTALPHRAAVTRVGVESNAHRSTPIAAPLPLNQPPSEAPSVLAETLQSLSTPSFSTPPLSTPLNSRSNPLADAYSGPSSSFPVHSSFPHRSDRTETHENGEINGVSNDASLGVDHGRFQGRSPQPLLQPAYPVTESNKPPPTLQTAPVPGTTGYTPPPALEVPSSDLVRED